MSQSLQEIILSATECNNHVLTGHISQASLIADLIVTNFLIYLNHKKLSWKGYLMIGL